MCTLTNTRSIATFGHTVGAEVNAGVTSPRVFALLIRAANSLSALVNICSEDSRQEKVRFCFFLSERNFQLQRLTNAAAAPELKAWLAGTSVAADGVDAELVAWTVFLALVHVWVTHQEVFIRAASTATDKRSSTTYLRS